MLVYCLGFVFSFSYFKGNFPTEGDSSKHWYILCFGESEQANLGKVTKCSYTCCQEKSGRSTLFTEREKKGERCWGLRKNLPLLLSLYDKSSLLCNQSGPISTKGIVAFHSFFEVTSILCLLMHPWFQLIECVHLCSTCWPTIWKMGMPCELFFFH